MVGAKELEEVPYSVGMVAGGMEIEMEVKPITWVRGNIYSNDDLPKPPPLLPRPVKPSSPTETRTVLAGENKEEVEEFISISRKALLEIWGGRSLDSLPEEFRQILAGESSGLTSWEPLHALLHDEAAIANPTSETLAQGKDTWLSDGETRLPLEQTQQLKSIVCMPQQIPSPSPTIQNQPFLTPIRSRQRSPTRKQNTQQPKGKPVTQAGTVPLGASLQETQTPPSTPIVTPYLGSDNETTAGRYVPSEETPHGDLLMDKPRTSEPTQGRQKDKNQTSRQNMSADVTSAGKDLEKNVGPTILTRPKRKDVASSSNLGPQKKTSQAGPMGHIVNEDTDGLVEVQIQYSDSLRLAQAIGVSTDDISRVLQADNADRMATLPVITEETDSPIGDHAVTFDPDPEDELEDEVEEELSLD